MTPLCFWIGSHQEVLDGGASFKIHLHPKLSANVLNALTKSTIVWHNYVGLPLVVHTGSVGWDLFTILHKGRHVRRIIQKALPHSGWFT